MHPASLILALATATFVGPALPLFAQSPDVDPFVGTWAGQLDVGGAGLRLIFHVARSPEGGLSGSLDSPDQGAVGLPATEVRAAKDMLHFALSSLGVRYDGTLSADGSRITGTFFQGPAKLPLELARVADDAAETAGPTRPQNPTPPLPYRVEEVHVESAPGVVLAGSLTLPAGDGPFPTAVLVTGSGPQDRDESLAGHKPFLVLSDHLTRAGIAVLRYDDRGVAGSTGDFAAATSEDFATDALAAVAFLRARPDIGPVGIVGHSEGGLVGPMAAARSDDVAYVVMLAGPGITGAEIIQMQSELIGRAEGTPEDALAFSRRMQERVFAILRGEPDPESATRRVRTELHEIIDGLSDEDRARMGAAGTEDGIEAQVGQVTGPWFRYFLTYDPRPTLERVRVPVLALNGGHDLQVPPEVDLREVEAALKRGGNPDVTVRLLPGLNHLFQKAPTGAPREYAQIEETMNPAALQAVSDWILERFARHR